MIAARSGLALAFALGVGGCGATIKRDLSTIPQGQVGFDDLCGVQAYFDAIEAGLQSEPVVASSAESEGRQDGKAVHGGRTRFVFESDFQLDELARVLNENWRRLPPGLDTTPRMALEVHWAERAGVPRVVADDDATLTFDGKSHALPYHVCLSELLFGRPLYAQRLVTRHLQPAVTKSMSIDFTRALAGDAGAPPEPAAGEASGAVPDQPPR
jgi:hypothetical protein